MSQDPRVISTESNAGNIPKADHAASDPDSEQLLTDDGFESPLAVPLQHRACFVDPHSLPASSLSSSQGASSAHDLQGQMFGRVLRDFGAATQTDIQTHFQSSERVLFPRDQCLVDPFNYKRDALVSFTLDTHGRQHIARNVQIRDRRNQHGSCPEASRHLICRGKPCVAGMRCRRAPHCKFCHTHCRDFAASDTGCVQHTLSKTEGHCKGQEELSITLELALDLLPPVGSQNRVLFSGRAGTNAAIGTFRSSTNRGRLEVCTPQHKTCNGGSSSCRGEEVAVLVELQDLILVGHFRYHGRLLAAAEQFDSGSTSDDDHSIACCSDGWKTAMRADDACEASGSDHGQPVDDHTDGLNRESQSWDAAWNIVAEASTMITPASTNVGFSASSSAARPDKLLGHKQITEKSVVLRFLRKKMSQEVVDQVASELQSRSGFDLRKYTEEDIDIIASKSSSSAKIRNTVVRGLLFLHDGINNWSSTVSVSPPCGSS